MNEVELLAVKSYTDLFRYRKVKTRNGIGVIAKFLSVPFQGRPKYFPRHAWVAWVSVRYPDTGVTLFSELISLDDIFPKSLE